MKRIARRHGARPVAGWRAQPRHELPCSCRQLSIATVSTLSKPRSAIRFSTAASASPLREPPKARAKKERSRTSRNLNGCAPAAAAVSSATIRLVDTLRLSIAQAELSARKAADSAAAPAATPGASVPGLLLHEDFQPTIGPPVQFTIRAKSMAKSACAQPAVKIGRQIVRGVLGGLFGGGSRRR